MSEDVLKRLFEAKEGREQQAEAFYAMLTERRQLKSHRAVTYRCERRCMLADVLVTQAGILVHLPPYRLSPSVNAVSSSESGRRERTIDGDRRWRPRTFMLADALNITFNCDHVRSHVLENAVIESDVSATRGEVVIRT